MKLSDTIKNYPVQKERFVILFIIFLLSVSSVGQTASEIVVGEFSYTCGDDETVTQCKEKCRRNAMTQAVESAKVYVNSETNVASGMLQRFDIYSHAEGFLTNVKILAETLNGRNFYCRVQGNVDVENLEEEIRGFIENYKIKPNKKVRILFHAANIDESQAYGSDDYSKPAPDAYLMVKDRHENTIFLTGQAFLAKKKYWRMITNRNNYSPDFNSASFTYTFTDDDALLIYVVDWDGFEGFLGQKKSSDDIIGTPYRLSPGHPLGRSWVRGKGWKLEVEILEIQQSSSELE